MSQTPTYDQLRDERITVASDVDSAQLDQSGKHRLGDDLAAAPLRDRSPGPDADPTDEGSAVQAYPGIGAVNTDPAMPHPAPRRQATDHHAGKLSSLRTGPGSARRSPDRAGSDNVAAWMHPSMLIERTVAVLRVLAELDIRAGNRVLIMLPEGPGFTESFAAVFYRDAVPLPVNPLLGAPELTAAIAQAHTRLVLASLVQLPTLAELPTRAPILIHSPQGPWAAALPLP